MLVALAQERTLFHHLKTENVKTITINLYSFDELTMDAQCTAIHNWKQDEDNELPQPDQDWDEWIKDHAKDMGIKITSFNTDHYCKGNFTHNAEYTANLIQMHYQENKDHPLYLTVKVYEQEKSCLFSKQLEAQLDGEEVENPHPDLKLAEQELLYSLLEDFRIMLRDEWEYRTGNGAIEEQLQIEGEVFTMEGEKLDFSIEAFEEDQYL